MPSKPIPLSLVPAEAGAATDAAASLSLDLWLLQGEAMGWRPLGEGAYWHDAAVAASAASGTSGLQAAVEGGDMLVVHVVGCPDPGLTGLPVLLLT